MSSKRHIYIIETDGDTDREGGVGGRDQEVGNGVDTRFRRTSFTQNVHTATLCIQ